MTVSLKIEKKCLGIYGVNWENFCESKLLLKNILVFYYLRTIWNSGLTWNKLRQAGVTK